MGNFFGQHPAFAAGGGGGAGPLVGASVHWFTSPAWTIAAGEAWNPGYGYGVGSVDFDTDGFWNPDDNGLFVPLGQGGLYAVRLAAVFDSATATGFVSANPSGTAAGTFYAPCLFADTGTPQVVVSIDVSNEDETSSTFATPHVTNYSDHDIEIGRVELMMIRMGPQPA